MAKQGLTGGWDGLITPAGWLMVGGSLLGVAVEHAWWGRAAVMVTVVLIWVLELRTTVEGRVRREKLAMLEEIQGWRDEIADTRQEEEEHASR